MRNTNSQGFKSLIVYRLAYVLAMEIFEMTKSFPKEEKYSLTDQIRRSSRSVAANLAEGYRKRNYPAYFLSKMIDCDGENSETQVWLDFSLACQYISESEHQSLTESTDEVGKLLYHLIHFPEKYGVKTDKK